MLWFILFQIVSFIIDVIHLRFQTDTDKNIEILLLRRELAILQRHQSGVIRPDRTEKMFITALMMRLKNRAGYQLKQLRDIISSVQPENVLGWHRQLVRRKWTQKRSASGGRPPTNQPFDC